VSGRSRKKARTGGRRPWYESVWLRGLLLVAVGAWLGLALSGGAGPWWRVLDGDGAVPVLQPGNPGGPVGAAASFGLHVAFGAVWCWAFPLVMIIIGVRLVAGTSALPLRWVVRAAPLWLVTAAFLAQPGMLPEQTGRALGGVVGFALAEGFRSLFGLGGMRIFLGVFLLAAVIFVLRPWLGWLPGVLGRLLGGLGPAASAVGRALLLPVTLLGRGLVALKEFVAELLAWRPAPRSHDVAEDIEAETAEAPAEPATATTAAQARRERVVHNEPEVEATPAPPPPEPVEVRELPGAAGEFAGDEDELAERPATPRPKPKRKARGPMAMPGLELLTPAGPEGQPVAPVELDTAADLLEDTLRSFGVEGEVKDVRPGPVVTTFEYQPGPGIRVSQIVQRSDDLALAMRARSIRMEAPIPGKAAVGIEIPNPKARMVRLREVLELTGGAERTPLSVVLGKDVVGRPVSVDLATLPHLLVAGSTGSGKSVCLNAIISNLLLTNDPSRLRLCLIDPKMLEMNVYNGIPHLLLPVVTDPREALKALQWMVAQMEFRYRTLAKHSVRNILQYNEKVARGEITDQDGERVDEPMPYFLTIVDELADLMMQLGNDIEGPITRLAQKARAVGIHLILATQRPSVDVITGVIKANIPCRIAFRVIQRNDSRTILDMNGAEQLLGHGDMLYLQPGRALPVRVHGSFIDVDECEAIAAHWRQYEGATEEISLNEGTGGGDGSHTGEDDLFDEAVRVVVTHQSGSTSLLQRRLRIGYTRAGRLMDMMEEAGIVGPFTGSKARDVLIKPEELDALEGES
jgi:S-DNA-T family DNA segregation ATPase FtsK/SpoIIIE